MLVTTSPSFPAKKCFGFLHKQEGEGEGEKEVEKERMKGGEENEIKTKSFSNKK